MATPTRKRKREIQDENHAFSNNFQYLRYVGELKRRKVDAEKIGIDFKETLPDKFQWGKQSSGEVSLRKTPGSAKKASRRRRSLPLRPTYTETQNLDIKKNSSSTSLEDAVVDDDDDSDESLPPAFGTRNSTLRRSLSGFARRSFKNLRGTLRSKMADKIRKNAMHGKEDYSLPVVTAQLDFCNFFTAQQPKQDKKKDAYLQQKIDYEIKMRDGTAKLLAASKHPHQQLEAAKNLLASNTRMLAYMTELQKRKTNEVLRQDSTDSGNQEACKAKLCVSDIRIPLMWKQTDHFKNKGDHRRYAVFCLWKIGTEIVDTTLLRDVDREMTDLSFDDVLHFGDIGPDFECSLEVYCHKQCDDLTISSTHRRIKKKFTEISDSIGRSVGKRISGLKDDSDFMANMLVGPKFEKIAHATLRLKDVCDSFGIFDLVTTNNPTDANSTELPLFGHFCCRLAAVPSCLVTPTVTGNLEVKSSGTDWSSYWCVLQNLQISCWPSENEAETGEPCLTIPFTKEAQVHHCSPSTSQPDRHCLQITTTARRYNKVQYSLATNKEEDHTRWWNGLQQHLLDQAMWQHACDKVMDIRRVSTQSQNFPRRSSRPISAVEGISWKDGVEDSPMSKILARLKVDDEPDSSPALPSTSTETPTTKTKLETDV